MTLTEWNNLPKTTETDHKAIKGDVATCLYGIAYLIQRTNNGNNVIALRISPGTKSVRQSFLSFRRFCKRKNIQYIRVEGNPRRYFFLMKAKRLKGYDCRFNQEEAYYTGRNVFYIKLY